MLDRPRGPIPVVEYRRRRRAAWRYIVALDTAIITAGVLILSADPAGIWSIGLASVAGYLLGRAHAGVRAWSSR